MTNSQKVNMALAYKNISKSTLAKAMNTSVQNLSQKITRNTLTTKELEEIAKILGCQYYFGFEFPDGTKI